MGILCRHAIRVVLGVIALSFGAAWATEPAWPGFRGPDANPIVPNGTLPEKWSKTENVWGFLVFAYRSVELRNGHSLSACDSRGSRRDCAEFRCGMGHRASLAGVSGAGRESPAK